MREMGLPSVFFVHHFPKQKIVFINQSTYIQKLVDKFELVREYQKATPCTTAVKLEPVIVESGEEFTQNPYRSLVGELLCLSVCTHPAYAVGICLSSWIKLERHIGQLL